MASLWRTGDNNQEKKASEIASAGPGIDSQREIIIDLSEAFYNHSGSASV